MERLQTVVVIVLDYNIARIKEMNKYSEVTDVGSFSIFTYQLLQNNT